MVKSNYSRCPHCGGEEVFKPETGMLVCTRCGSTFPVSDGENKPVKRPYSPAFTIQNIEANQYECATCGAQIVVGTDGEVKRCASCGNTTLKKTTTLVTAPDGVIPFTISKKQAADIFRNWVGSRKFAPSDLKQMAKLEKISGLYVPIYNFSFTASWYYQAIGIKRKLNDDGSVEYNDYPVEKIKDSTYSNIVKTATSKISNSFVQGLGDYDLAQIKPYSTDYLLGFSGLNTDVDIHKVFGDITDDISKDNERRARDRLKEDYFDYESFTCRTRYKDIVFNYTYVPVWANHYTYKGKQYHCYINGQTGRATGKAPKSGAKMFGCALGILAAIVGVVAIVIALL